MSAKAEKSGEGTKKKNMLPMIIGVVAVVLGLFIGKTVFGGTAADKDKKAKDKKEKKEAKIGHKFPLDEFVVNLQGKGDHYLKTNIAIGLKEGLTEEKVKEEVAPIRDSILTVLSSKSLKDLSSSKDREELKAEIVEKINKETEDEPVVKVYFTAFATQ